MGMNPPRIERQDVWWGWWAQPEFAVPILYRHHYGDPDDGWVVPTSIREVGRHLVGVRNFHPMDAIWMVREGMDHVAMRTSPADWKACRTYQDWLKGFPDPAMGSQRRWLR